MTELPSCRPHRDACFVGCTSRKREAIALSQAGFSQITPIVPSIISRLARRKVLRLSCWHCSLRELRRPHDRRVSHNTVTCRQLASKWQRERRHCKCPSMMLRTARLLIFALAATFCSTLSSVTARVLAGDGYSLDSHEHTFHCGNEHVGPDRQAEIEAPIQQALALRQSQRVAATSQPTAEDEAGLITVPVYWHVIYQVLFPVLHRLHAAPIVQHTLERRTTRRIQSAKFCELYMSFDTGTPGPRYAMQSHPWLRPFSRAKGCTAQWCQDSSMSPALVRLEIVLNRA